MAHCLYLRFRKIFSHNFFRLSPVQYCLFHFEIFFQVRALIEVALANDIPQTRTMSNSSEDIEALSKPEENIEQYNGDDDLQEEKALRTKTFDQIRTMSNSSEEVEEFPRMGDGTQEEELPLPKVTRAISVELTQR